MNMTTKLTLNKNRHGNEFISLPLFDKELLLFSEKHNITRLPSLLSEVNLPKIEFSETTRGHICLSRLNSTDLFEYSTIGEWRKIYNYIYLNIEGKGTFRLDVIFNEEINVIEIIENASRKRWAISIFQNVSELPFNPDNF